MRKLCKVLIICISLVFFTGINVFAEDSESMIEAQEKIESDSRVERFYNYINNLEIEEEILDGLSAKEYITTYLKTGQDPISIEKIWKAVVSLLFREVRTSLSLVISILVIALLSALLKNLQSAFTSDDGVTSIAFYVCYSIIILLLTKSFLVSLDITKQVIMSVVDFMNVLLPVLVFLIGSAGGITTSLTIDPIVLTTVMVTPKVYINIIFPLIVIYFALQLISSLGAAVGININQMCKFVKTIVMTCQGFMITVFVAILSIRGMTANTLDAVTVKSIKFAVDNFIPFVGKAFSDAITTVAGYSVAMKSVISTLGVIIMVVIVLYPIIKLFIMSLALKLTGAVLQPVTDSNITSSVGMAGEALTMLMSCVISVSIMFFIMISMIASSGKFIIGG